MTPSELYKLYLNASAGPWAPRLAGDLVTCYGVRGSQGYQSINMEQSAPFIIAAHNSMQDLLAMEARVKELDALCRSMGAALGACEAQRDRYRRALVAISNLRDSEEARIAHLALQYDLPQENP